MSRKALFACTAAMLVMATMLVVAAAWADEKFVVRERVGEVSPEVSFDFKDAKFADVIDHLSKQSGRNIIIEGKIEDTVTLRLVGVKWQQALEMVCQQVGAVIEEQTDQVIRISKPVTINFELEDAPLSTVISTISRLAEATVIIGPGVKGVVTAQFYEVPWTQALGDVVRTNGYVLLKEGKVMRVMDPGTLEAQLTTRVFHLRYIQPAETYTPKLSSKYVAEGKGAEAVGGVTGAGEVLTELGVPNTAAMGGSTRARAASTGGGGTSGGTAEFPLLSAIQRIASKKGRVDYIPSTNALIVTDTEPNIKAIAELVDAMDKEPMQVFIDVKFVSTDLSNKYNRGVDWKNGVKVSQTYGSVASPLPFSLGGGYLKRFSSTGARPTTAESDTAVGDLSDRSGPFKFGLLDFSQMSTVLELLATDENSELKQSPQILCLDNHQAMIFVGETIRFAETDSASNQSGGVEVGIKEASSSPVDTGFQLYVRPHIIAGENKVILTVIPKAEQLSGTGTTITGFDDFTNGVASIQLPRIQSSTLVTKLLMKSGQTAVLGGMISESVSKTEHKVPILGDIPIIGWAFKWKSDLKTKSNLLVFLSVYVVKSDSEMKEIYTVYGDRYGGKTYKDMEADTKLRWNEPKEKGYTEPAPEPTKTAAGNM